MKVSIIVGGRFHAFNLAEFLDKKKNLKQLITSYPKFFIKKKFDIDVKNVDTVLSKEILSRLCNLLNITSTYNDKIIDYFDNNASKLLKKNNVDILVGWSSFALKSFQKIKKEKCIKILERGSTHIEFQKDILKAEYEKFSIKPNLPSNHIIKKEKQEYDLADYIMVPSEFAKKTFLNKGFKDEKIIKVPYGVSLKHFKSVDLKNNKNKKFRIIYVGSLSIRKGIIYLLKSFSELDLSNSELLLIGNIEKDIKKLIDPYIKKKNIFHLNPKEQNHLSKYYNSSDIFVTCSLEEGLSMVQIQAMACGIPLITTPNSGSEDIITNGIEGFIIPIRDTIILKEKIRFFYNNPLKVKLMGNKAKLKVKKSLSWDNYGEKVLKVYEAIRHK